MSNESIPPRRLLEGSPSDGHFSSGVELLTKALKSVFLILAITIVLAIAWFLSCGGSFIVNSTTESVIVLQFGKYHEQYNEGWHWFLPYPINKIVRISTVKRTVRSTTFLPVNAQLLYDPKAQPSTVSDPYDLVPGVDGYALLGDNCIMHSDWIMTYRVTDPKKYFLNCMSKETEVVSTDDTNHEAEEENVSLNVADLLLQNLLDDAVIVSSACLDLKNTYYDKNNYEVTVKQNLIRNLEKMDIGISLESLSLKIVNPPIRTIRAFQELLLAETTAEAEVEAANTYTVEQENKSMSESAVILADAEAYKKRVVSEIQSEVQYFNLMLEQQKKDKKSTLITLFNEKLGDAVAASRENYIMSSAKDGQLRQIRVKINPEPVIKKKADENAEEGNEE